MPPSDRKFVYAVEVDIPRARQQAQELKRIFDDALTGSSNSSTNSAFRQQQAQLTAAARAGAKEREAAARAESAERIEAAKRLTAVTREEERRRTIEAQQQSRQRVIASEQEAKQRQAAAVRSVGRAVGGAALGAAGALGVAFGAREIAQGAMELSRLRTEIKRSDIAFQSLSGSEAAAAANLDAVRKASGGAIDRLQAQGIATQALTLGLASNAEELERIVKVGRVVATVSPVINDTASAISEIGLASANLSFRRLDQLGLSVTEVKERMASLKAANGDLTDSQAFLNAVLDVSEQKFAGIISTLEDTTSGTENLTSAWVDLKIAIAESGIGEASDNMLRDLAFGIRQLSGGVEEVEYLNRALADIPVTIAGLQEVANRRWFPVDTSEQVERFQMLERTLKDLRTAALNGVPGAADLAKELGAAGENAAATGQVSDQLADQLAIVTEWLGRAAYAAGVTASSYNVLSASAAGAAAAMSATARLSGPELLAAQRAGIMTPGERERRANAQTISTKSTADYEREYYLLRREQEEKAAAAAEKAWSSAAGSVADSWSAEIESALKGVAGLFDTSDVTQADLDAAAAGDYLEKADEYLRQLRDEVRNGVDYAGVDIQDAAKRLGIDPSAPAEEILRQFEEAWDSSSLFAGGQNLDLINEEAVKREIDRQRQSKAGEQAIIDYFTGLYGPDVAQAAVGGAVAGGGGYAPAGTAGGAPLAATTAEGALAINRLTVDPAALAALQLEIDQFGIEIPISVPDAIASGYQTALAAQFAAELPARNQIGGQMGYEIAVAMAGGVTPDAATAYQNAIAGAFTPAEDDGAGGASGTMNQIGGAIGNRIALAMASGVTPDAMTAYLTALADVFTPKQEEGAGGIGGSLNQIGGTLGYNIATAMAGGVFPDTATTFLQKISTSFYAEESQIKARAMGADLRIPIFEGFTNSETMPPFAARFVGALNSQFRADTITEDMQAVGSSVIAMVHAGWSAGASEYDWVGPIVDAAQGQAAEQTVDAINESFTINLPGGSEGQ